MNPTVILGGTALLLLWGVWGLVAKFATNEIGMQVVIWGQVASLALFPFYFVLFKDLLPVQWNGIGIAWGLLAGALGISGTIVLYLLLRSAPTSIVIPISALYPVVTVVLAYIFLREELSLTRIIGVVCAVAAVWLLSA